MDKSSAMPRCRGNSNYTTCPSAVKAMYCLSRCETLSPSAMRPTVLSDTLVWGEVAERLVWPKAVVDGFMLSQQRVVRRQVFGDLHELVELLLVRPVGPLHLPV